MTTKPNTTKPQPSMFNLITTEHSEPEAETRKYGPRVGGAPPCHCPLPTTRRCLGFSARAFDLSVSRAFQIQDPMGRPRNVSGPGPPKAETTTPPLSMSRTGEKAKGGFGANAGPPRANATTMATPLSRTEATDGGLGIKARRGAEAKTSRSARAKTLTKAMKAKASSSKKSAKAKTGAKVASKKNKKIKTTTKRLNRLGEVEHDLPEHLRNAMMNWGPELRDRLAKEGCQVPTQAVRVGTDCSGLEAPLLSLQVLGVPHSHVFSSEINKRKRKFIETNFKHCKVYGDMMRRGEEPPRCDLYVCGFPCKPFSTLHRKSKGFKEVQAKPFTGVLKTLKTMLPPVAVLENVAGIDRYLVKVFGKLRGLRWYEVMSVRINPKDMGEPVHRDRIYFILVRVDVIRPGIDLDALVGKLLRVGTKDIERCDLLSRLLPMGSRLLQPMCHRRQALAPTQGSLVAKVGPQPNERQVLAYGAACSRATPGDRQEAVDLQLSEKWARMMDVCPTVTPGSKIWVTSEMRFITEVEKLLLNMVPVHLLKWPAELSQRDIHDLAGNTMHLKAVGLAMLIAISLVEWGPIAFEKPCTESPTRKAKKPRKVEPWVAPSDS